MTVLKTEGTMYFQTIDVELLTSQDMATILPSLDELKKWIADVEKKALDVVLNGENIEGYVLGEGRKTRKIIDENAIAEKLFSLGFPEASVFEKKMRGIPALEKLVGKKDFETTIGEYIAVEQGKPILVKEK